MTSRIIRQSDYDKAFSKPKHDAAGKLFIKTNSTDKEFRLFAKLPKELRIRIWQLAVGEGRFIFIHPFLTRIVAEQIQEGQMHPVVANRMTRYWEPTDEFGECEPPPLLFACPESHLITRESLETFCCELTENDLDPCSERFGAFEVHDVLGQMLINYQADFICILSLEYLLTYLTKEQQASCRHLIVHSFDLSHAWKDPSFPKMVRQRCKNLQTLVFADEYEPAAWEGQEIYLIETSVIDDPYVTTGGTDNVSGANWGARIITGHFVDANGELISSQVLRGDSI